MNGRKGGSSHATHTLRKFRQGAFELLEFAVALCGAVFLALLAKTFEFNPSTLSEPEKAETDVATRALRVLVWRRASQEVIQPRPIDRQASVDQGDTLYRVDCADCRGLDGHTPTDEGRWMYPRAANLVSSQVQRYSDRELFWIVEKTKCG
jgi:hypothetical protein